MIKLKNVSFSYNKNKQILDDISFEINKGECLILLGSNGVGKSTLISLILGINKVKSGNIYFDDIEIKDLKAKDKSHYLSYVPQLIEGNDLSVFDTILLGRLPYYHLYPKKEDINYVNNLIDTFNLNEIKEKNTNEISGGERQKVSILRGLSQNSELTIFDEPTSNLDMNSQAEILNLIKEEKNHNRSFLISMHDINQALHIGDRFIFLKGGKIYCICQKEEITEEIIDYVFNIKSKIINLENGEKYIIYEK